MKCVMCGGETDAGVRMTRPLNLSLPGVQLADVLVRTCASCGEEYDELPPPEVLLGVVTKVVVDRDGALSGPEIRFLRKRLGWSRKDFAEQFCVDDTTVSKWENGRLKLEAFKDKMLRVLAVRGPLLDDYGHDIDPDTHAPPVKVFVPEFTPAPAPARTRHRAARG